MFWYVDASPDVGIMALGHRRPPHDPTGEHLPPEQWGIGQFPADSVSEPGR